jgi:hypothetical protein
VRMIQISSLPPYPSARWLSNTQHSCKIERNYPSSLPDACLAPCHQRKKLVRWKWTSLQQELNQPCTCGKCYECYWSPMSYQPPHCVMGLAACFRNIRYCQTLLESDIHLCSPKSHRPAWKIAQHFMLDSLPGSLIECIQVKALF